MTKVIEATAGKIRDLPIKADLKALLQRAGEATGIDVVRVTSGGQARKGSGGKRTGSTRHDDGNAADLQLEKGGKVLSFDNQADRTVIADFVTNCARFGATGIGAGIDYMGPRTLHIGYGSKAVWGAGGRAASAPQWLKDAVTAASAAPAPSATLKRGDRGADVKRGDRGADVKRVQEKLFAHDGIFGSMTEIGVKAFQKTNGLPETGIVDAATRKALGI